NHVCDAEGRQEQEDHEQQADGDECGKERYEEPAQRKGKDHGEGKEVPVLDLLVPPAPAHDCCLTRAISSSRVVIRPSRRASRRRCSVAPSPAPWLAPMASRSLPV